jgi:GNAT superfamily N-acetyltransferase
MPTSTQSTGLFVRLATRGDVPAILRLYADDELGSRRENISQEALEGYLAAYHDIESDPRTALYVAQVNDSVVGTFQLTVLRHMIHRGGLAAQIEAVHVAAQSRRRGIGEAMVRFAIEQARKRGCRRIQLTSDKRRKDAHRFYERLGFVASHEGMRLALRATS